MCVDVLVFADGSDCPMSDSGVMSIDTRRDSSPEHLCAIIDSFGNQSTDQVGLAIKKLEELQVEVTSVRDDLKIQYDEIKALSQKIAVVSKFKNAVIPCAGETLQRYNRRKNIIISGVPVRSDEDVPTILSALAKMIGVDFHPDEVSTAYRLLAAVHRKPSIVVVFVSKITKVDWLKAKRNLRFRSANDIDSSFPSQPIYINEHLTSQDKEIFKGARRLVKDQVLNSAWTRDGGVLVRKRPGGRPFRVSHLHQLLELKGFVSGTEASQSVS